MLFALIEDNIFITQIITITLQTHGHRVIHFVDGVNFFHSLQTTTYDFILVNVSLPGFVSGFHIITYLQEHWPMLPMLVLSGDEDMEFFNLQVSYPLLPVLRHPFSLRNLLRSIEKAKHPRDCERETIDPRQRKEEMCS